MSVLAMGYRRVADRIALLRSYETLTLEVAKCCEAGEWVKAQDLLAERGNVEAAWLKLLAEIAPSAEERARTIACADVLEGLLPLLEAAKGMLNAEQRAIDEERLALKRDQRNWQRLGSTYR